MKFIYLVFLGALFFSVEFVSPACADPETKRVEDEIWDPIEPVNRGIFWFNDHADLYVIDPLARQYDWIMPDPVQKGVGNFFDNLRFPAILLSDIVQLEFTNALEATGRFLINSTVGIGGIMDVAVEVGLEKQDQDFGLALASHGVGPGPYLVLPILGASNLRDGFGRVVDTFVSPFYHLGTIFDLNDNDALAIGLGSRALDVLNQRADLLDAVKAARESSLDYYLFMQTAYYQHRHGMLGLEEGESTTAEDPLADPLE